MKQFAYLIAVIVFSVSAASFAETPKTISDPPFYIPTYEEYKSLREDNAKTYQEKLGQILTAQKLTMPQITKDEFDRMIKRSSDWHQFMQRVHAACTSEQKLEQTCKSLARLRVEILLNNPGDLFPGGRPHVSRGNTSGDGNDKSKPTRK